MAFTKITLDSAGKSFDRARAYLRAAKGDPDDPTTDNFAQALNEYFASIGDAQVQMVSGLNDLLERVDKIQTKLGVR